MNCRRLSLRRYCFNLESWCNAIVVPRHSRHSRPPSRRPSPSRRYYSVSSTNTTAMPMPSSSSSQSSPLRYDRDTGVVYSEAHVPLYQTIIGIEIHAQLDVPAKLFSSAPRTTTSNILRRGRGRRRLRAGRNGDTIAGVGDDGGGSPNGSVHAYDLAYPGTLPAPPSRDVIHSAILACSALDCDIRRVSRFERKHYFYPDLPSGYQITQQRWPLAKDGMVTFVPHGRDGTAVAAAAAIATSAEQQLEREGGGRTTAKKRRRGVAGNVDDKHNDHNNDEIAINDDHEASSPTNGKIANVVRPLTLRIERVQLEQDTGKTTTTIMTETDRVTSTTRSFVDYNRAGCALVEIVSHPDLRSANEVAGAVERIRSLLRHVGSCDGRMEEGSLRCDLNVSIAPVVAMDIDADDEGRVRDGELAYSGPRRTMGGGDDEDLPPNTGHRVEVKNLNSIRQIVAATEYEALRQSRLAMLDSPTGRETRTFVVKPTSRDHPLGGETHCIRAKGDSVDYRFMPEPDLPPLILDEITLGIEGRTMGKDANDGMSSSASSYCPIKAYVERFMPESIESARARLVSDYGLTEDVAQVITSDPPAITMFEEAVTFARSERRSMNECDEDELHRALPTMVANWMCNDLFALVKKSAARGSTSSGRDGEGRKATDIDDGINETSTLDHPISMEYSTVDSERLGALVAMVAKGALTSSMAKKVLTVMFDDDGEEGGEESSCRYSHPDDIAKRHGWRVISDWDALVQLCEGAVLDPRNAAQLEQYKVGDERKRRKINKFYVGKVMAASNGNAHPERMKEALAFVLDGTH